MKKTHVELENVKKVNLHNLENGESLHTNEDDGRPHHSFKLHNQLEYDKGERFRNFYPHATAHVYELPTEVHLYSFSFLPYLLNGLPFWLIAWY